MGRMSLDALFGANGDARPKPKLSATRRSVPGQIVKGKPPAAIKEDNGRRVLRKAIKRKNVDRLAEQHRAARGQRVILSQTHSVRNVNLLGWPGSGNFIMVLTTML